MTLTKESVYGLHRKYSHGIYQEKILELVWTHSLIVEEMSVMLATNVKQKYGIVVDLPLVRTGARIHDIGFYGCFDDNYNETKKYLFHGLVGYELLKKDKIGEDIARFALVHTGVGVEHARAIEAGLPKNRNYIPVTPEEEIVTYADCFHSKGHVSFSYFEDIEEQMSRKRPEDVPILYRFREKYGIPDIDNLEKKYGKWQKEINDWAKATNNE